MTFNMNGGSAKRQLEELLLALLNESNEAAKRRKREDAMFRDYEETLKGFHGELTEQSDYYTRQLIAADPYKAIAQMVTVAQEKNVPLDFSFVNEEMYALIDGKERDKVRELINKLDGINPNDPNFNLDEHNKKLEEKKREMNDENVEKDASIEKKDAETNKKATNITASDYIWSQIGQAVFEKPINDIEEIKKLERNRIIAVWSKAPVALKDDEEEKRTRLLNSNTLSDEEQKELAGLNDKYEKRKAFEKEHKDDMPVEFTKELQTYLETLERREKQINEAKAEEKGSGNSRMTLPSKDERGLQSVNFQFGGNEKSIVLVSLSDEEKDNLEALRFMKKQWEIFKKGESMPENMKKVAEDDLFKTFVFSKMCENADLRKQIENSPLSTWLARNGKLGIHIDNGTTVEKFLMENLDKSVLRNDRDLYPNFNKGNGKVINLFADGANHKSLSFVGKVNLCEQGVETAYSRTLEKVEKVVSESMKSDLYSAMRRRGVRREQNAKGLAVITKKARFLKKDVTIDVYDRCEKDRSAIISRQIHKNEGLVADRNTDIYDEEKKEEKKETEKKKKDDPIERNIPPEDDKRQDPISEADEKEARAAGQEEWAADQEEAEARVKREQEQRSQSQSEQIRSEKSQPEQERPELNLQKTYTKMSDEELDNAYHLPITAKQEAMARTLGVEITEGMVRGELSQLLEEKILMANPNSPLSPWHGFVPFEKRNQAEQEIDSFENRPEPEDYFVPDESDRTPTPTGRRTVRRNSGTVADLARIYEANIEDPETNSYKPVSVIVTEKGTYVVDAEEMQKLQKYVSKAGEQKETIEVEGAGSTTFGTMEYMFRNILDDFDNGTIDAVANIIKADVAMVASMTLTNISNLPGQLSEGFSAVADSLNSHKEQFHSFVNEKIHSIDDSLASEQDHKLSDIRPFQEISLASLLSAENKQEYNPVIDRSFDAFNQIVSDERLSRQYFEEMMNEPKVDYFDLGIAAVIRNDREALEQIEEEYHDAHPEVFEQEPDFSLTKTCVRFVNRFCNNPEITEEIVRDHEEKNHEVNERERDDDLGLELTLGDD